MRKSLVLKLTSIVVVSSSALVVAFSITTSTSRQRLYQSGPQWRSSALFETSDEPRKGGSFRFTGTTGAETTNTLDKVLSWIVSDVGSIALGGVGLLIAVGNRLAQMDSLNVDTLGQETRSDLLAVFACGAVLLNGISKLDVTSALADEVVLDGTEVGTEISHEEAMTKPKDIGWALESILVATPAKTAVIVAEKDGQWTSLARAGLVPPSSTGLPLDAVKAPIMQKFRGGYRKETYLPTLQALPGRTEFTYLPSNMQEALLLPVPSSATTVVLVLGSNRAKSFTPRDVAWCQALAARIGTFL